MLNQDELALLDALYRKYYRYLFICCHALFDFRPEYIETVEDCVQETFLKAVLNIKRLKKHESPMFWLKRTSYNVTISKRRLIHNRKRIIGYPLPLDDIGQAIDPKDDITDWLNKIEIMDKRTQFIISLSKQELEVYHLIYEEKKTIKETCVITNASNGSIRGTLQRIRTKISKINFIFFFVSQCFFLFSRTK